MATRETLKQLRDRNPYNSGRLDGDEILHLFETELGESVGITIDEFLGNADVSTLLTAVSPITLDSSTDEIGLDETALVPGSSGEILFNDGGTLGADSGLTYDGKTLGVQTQSGQTDPLLNLQDTEGNTVLSHSFRIPNFVSSPTLTSTSSGSTDYEYAVVARTVDERRTTISPSASVTGPDDTGVVYDWNDNTLQGWTDLSGDLTTDSFSIEGSHSLFTGNSSGKAGEVIPTGYSGGKKPKSLSFYYYENKSESNGIALQVLNSNGQEELKVGNSSLAYEVDGDTDGQTFAEGTDRASTDTWFFVRVEFDWDNGRFDVLFKDLEAGNDYWYRNYILKSNTDVEKLVLGAFSEFTGGNSTYDWIDSLKLTDSEGVTVSWDSLNNADSYVLLRDVGGVWEEVQTTDSTQVFDPGYQTNSFTTPTENETGELLNNGGFLGQERVITDRNKFDYAFRIDSVSEGNKMRVTNNGEMVFRDKSDVNSGTPGVAFADPTGVENTVLWSESENLRLSPTTGTAALWLNSGGATRLKTGRTIALEVNDQTRIFLDIVNDWETEIRGTLVGKAQSGQTDPLLSLKDENGNPLFTDQVSGDRKYYSPGAGVILTSPDGNTTKRVYLDNSGNLQTETP